MHLTSAQPRLAILPNPSNTMTNVIIVVMHEQMTVDGSSPKTIATIAIKIITNQYCSHY